MPNPTAKPRRRWLSSLLAMTLALLAGCLFAVATAPAKSNSEKLEAVEEKIGAVEEREGVLTSDIEAMGDEISALEGQVSALRNQEAAAEEELVAKQAELDRAEAELKKALRRLETLRGRLKRALVVLRDRLVAIYTYGSTDITSVVLSAEDYGDMVARTEYFDAINESDAKLAERVRELRDEAKKLVRVRKTSKLTIEKARDQIAAKEQRLEATRSTLESREGALLSARAERRRTLKGIEGERHEHEEVASEIRAEIAQEIAEATGGGVALPVGPMPSPSAAGFIWPLEGTLTSGFGYRWGRMHEGIDISVPEGTPIRAAASGTVILMQSEYESGGYGNYTCIDHGGGLSTCYAHQSSFSTSVGAQVSQGDVIGLSGNTGHSTGPHLHFEVRINGAATDPLGYL